MTPVEPARPLRPMAPEPIRTAFRELHGCRLHGFALLLTLGDRARAGALASEALAAGETRIERLRHPERAAAWLRERVTRRAARAGVGAGRRGSGWASLTDLGAEAPIVAGLAVLDRLQRAAIIAADVEGLDSRDVAGIVGRDGGRLTRLLSAARRRYAAAHAGAMVGTPPEDGPLAQRLHEIAQRAMA